MYRFEARLNFIPGENRKSVLRWRARQRGKQWEEKLQCLLKYVLQWRSLCAKSQSLTHQLILLKAQSQWFCLDQAKAVYGEGQCKWKHMRKYTPTSYFFFSWMNICSSLRVRIGNITGSKGYFLDWSFAQDHILRSWERTAGKV